MDFFLLFLPKQHYQALTLVFLLFASNQNYCNCQSACTGFSDLFTNLNKFGPIFDNYAYTTGPVRVDATQLNSLVQFQIYDNDTQSFDSTQFTVTTNDTNFYVTVDAARNTFSLNFKGSLFYNVNNAHRYALQMTATDNGVPALSTTALVFVPLVNYNVNAPKYTGPVVIDVAINFNYKIYPFFAILNAYDIDGDQVTYEFAPNTPALITNTIQVFADGRLQLLNSLDSINASALQFNVTLKDDGSCCNTQPPVSLSSTMQVTINIIDVNLYSPQFIANTNNINYCNQIYYAQERTYFTIELMAQDLDTRPGGNGEIRIVQPYIDGVVPQNSFAINDTFVQANRTRKAIIYNTELFDYKRPKYGSNTLYLMYTAEDNGKPRRFGYCFLTIQIQDANDYAPVFSQTNYNIYISKGSYSLTKWTYRFIATDQDSGLNGTVQYQFANNTSPNITQVFSLSVDGLLQISDYSMFLECKVPFQFQIIAYDLSPFRNQSRPANVNIIKTPSQMLPPFFYDFPANNTLTANVSEMTTRGTQLQSFGLLMQSDMTNQFLRCYLSPKPSPEWFSFKYLNPSNALQKKESCVLSVETQLNYIVAPSIVIFMVAELGSSQEPTTARELKILTVNLQPENIHSPTFLVSTLEGSCVEGSDDLNRTIVIVRAFDLDTVAPFNTVTYSFIGQSTYFDINPKTGEIKLVKPIRGVRTVNLEVLAQDGAPGYGSTVPNSNTIYVNIRVIDVNDNPPAFAQGKYTFNIADNAQPGAVIGYVDGVDADTESNFTFSINDPTFGIQFAYIASLATTIANYKGSAQIYLNEYLDYYKKNQYNVLITVSDSTYTAQTNVIINVVQVNNRPSVFQPMASGYQVTLTEKTIPTPAQILQMQASNQDPSQTRFTYNIYSTPFINASWFTLNAATGALSVSAARLNRDAPYGRPVQYLPISVANDTTLNLTTYSTVQLTLVDINDHAPQPQFINAQQTQLTMPEAIANAQVDLFFIDVDDFTLGNGPPFKITLNTYANMFGLSAKNCLASDLCTNRSRYSLFAMQPLDRNKQKFYDLSYTAADNQFLSTTGTMRIVVGDMNNNPQADGSKLINIIKLQNNIAANSYLGTLFVNDLDDWDLVSKTASNCQSTPANLFTIGQGLQIYGPNRTDVQLGSDGATLSCRVTDPSAAPIGSTVQALVTFSVVNVEYVDLNEITFIRLLNQTAEDLVYKPSVSATSKLDTIRNTLVAILQADYVVVVTVRNFNANNNRYGQVANAVPPVNYAQFGCEVYFYAVKSNRYISSLKAYYLLSNNLNGFTGFNVKLVADMCATKADNYCAANTFCQQNYVYTQADKLVAEGNATALAGIDGFMDAECFCNVNSNVVQCYNGGTLVQNAQGYYYCQCPSGYDGARCELLALTFTFNPSSTSHSYALFDAFQLCGLVRIEMEFVTDRQRGLLLFNGPINREALYFVAIEIVNGSLIVHVGSNTIVMNGLNVADSAWHKLDVLIAASTVQVIVDKCNSKTINIVNMNALQKDLNQVNDNAKLSIGGIPPSISSTHYYYATISVFEYEGCIRNVKINGQLRNLQLVQNAYNLAQANCDCKYLDKLTTNCINILSSVAVYEFPWWIILIIIAALLLLALILGLAVCTMRRKDTQKKFLQMFPDDDIRETIINYADGAGEENTENYNIDGMKIPITKQVVFAKPTTAIAETSLNDQYLVFANEGEGSNAGSLSSINTDESDQELEFDDLPTYGSKFSRLATLLNPVIMNVQSLLNEANEYETHSNRGYDTHNERNPNLSNRMPKQFNHYQ